MFRFTSVKNKRLGLEHKILLAYIWDYYSILTF